ncbi:hypothetical protein Zmor_007497 [Zophobas morio]|uniref:Replication protein A C-terminal domain-containing protein n=2 Tax=Zophobas morio TaxID=2755281 RepID=A0AA38IS30_9CUCU|nr:hypothetical protein Zmor_007497 [Zophobas morio]
MSVNGGFVNDGEGGGGSATKKREQVRRVQSVVPVFISYITECSDEEFTLYGMPVQMVDIIGVLRNFDVQSTKATCLIEDQSGSIQAILWLETDGDSISALPPVKENCYVRVFGSIRTQDGSKMIMILKIIPIDDLNVVTHHRLQIIHAKVYAEKLATGGLPATQPVNHAAATNGTMSFGDIKINTPQENPHGLKPIQAKIMSLLKNTTNYMGMAKSEILAQFDSAQAREVRATLDFLLDEGHAYTTCDNDHYKATDGF